MRLSGIGSAILLCWLTSWTASGQIRMGCVANQALCRVDARGKMAGFWPELFEEVGRREGVTVEWRVLRGPVEAVFDSGQVDLLPAVSPTAERKAKYYFTRPWWVEDYFLITPGGSPYYQVEDLRDHLILRFDGPPLTYDPGRFFPGARIEVERNVEEAIARGCSGEAAALLMSGNQLETGFLRGMSAPMCKGAPWRLIPFDGVLLELAVASFPHNKALAERFRDRLEEMLDDGTLSRIAAHHFPTHRASEFLLRLESANYRGRILRVVVVGLGLLLTLSVVFLYSLSRSTKETAGALGQLRDLTRQVLRLEDEERRRLARELHDGVGQQLVAIKMDADQIQKKLPGPAPEAEMLLAELRQLATEAGQDLRTLSFLLHPPMLEELGLETALRALVEGFTVRSGIAVKLELGPGVQVTDPALQLALYRIVQESLVNVQKHSSAKTAQVRLRAEGRKLRLQVEDQGQPLRAAGEGLGIASMGERARLLGGQLEVRHEPEGTIVEGWFPVSG